MKTKPIISLVTTLAAVLLNSNVSADPLSSGALNFPTHRWTEVNPSASWAPRAGLQVVELRNRFFLMGGRTPLDPAVVGFPGASILWNDVWTSDDLGT
jgi:hypothetical protein